MSTSFEKRQSQRRKSRDNLTKMKMPNSTPATSLATAANSMEQDEGIISQLDLHPSADGRNDFYCWICHKEGEVICCDVCPRVYHEDCMPRVKGVEKLTEKEFFCPECTRIADAENTASRIASMKNISSTDLAMM